jgi:hypothetical protein
LQGHNRFKAVNLMAADSCLSDPVMSSVEVVVLAECIARSRTSWAAAAARALREIRLPPRLDAAAIEHGVSVLVDWKGEPTVWLEGIPNQAETSTEKTSRVLVFLAARVPLPAKPLQGCSAVTGICTLREIILE